MTFEALDLHPNIMKAIAKAGYPEPTQIQSKAIPKIVRGFDIMGSAQTGTGKTAAFLLPALHKITRTQPQSKKGPRILILVPTRELAMQIEAQASKYSKYLDHVKSVCIVGGVPYPPQMRQLSRPYEILIATPGRLIDHIERGKINFNRLEMLVLDEADRMLDMGFLEPVEEIVAQTPETRQTLMFSATLQGKVLELAEKLLSKPMQISVQGKKESHKNITQTLHYVDDIRHKNQLLDHILSGKDIETAIVFTATKRHADQLVGELHEKGTRAAALHGDMSQRQRTRTITRLRNGQVKILVATDVAARGIDVDSISHVINFDLPHSAEDYVHRIGRTGRAGAKGNALSFAAGKDGILVKQIEEYTGKSLEVTEYEGLEPKVKKLSMAPTNRRSNSRRRPSRGGPRRRASAGGEPRTGSKGRTYSKSGPSKRTDSKHEGRSGSSRREGKSFSSDRPSRRSDSRNERKSSFSDRPSRRSDSRSEGKSSFSDRPKRRSDFKKKGPKKRGKFIMTPKPGQRKTARSRNR